MSTRIPFNLDSIVLLVTVDWDTRAMVVARFYAVCNGVDMCAALWAVIDDNGKKNRPHHGTFVDGVSL